jgi:uncharacterized protein YacL
MWMIVFWTYVIIGFLIGIIVMVDTLQTEEIHDDDDINQSMIRSVFAAIFWPIIAGIILVYMICRIWLYVPAVWIVNRMKK